MANSTLGFDNQFGPVIAQYFDFTQLFEETVFSIGPSALFLCAFPLRVAWLWHKPRAVSGSILHSNKLIAISLLLASQVVCLGFWASPGTYKTRASVVAAALTVADAVALGVLSHLEHLRSVQPSLLINLYVLFSLPLDVARARTLWIRDDSVHLAAAFSSTVSVKLLVLIIEAFEKRSILLRNYANYPPESTSGIYSRSFFWWLNPLLRNGFRKILTDEDLYPVDAEMRSEAVHRLIMEEWAKERDKTRNNALLLRTMWAIRWSLAWAIFPRLCVTAFQFVQPFLIASVINFISASEAEQPNNIGWALAAAYGLDYVGLAVANGAFYHQTYRMVTITRGALVSIIYSQTVDLQLTSVDESQALTLMSTDVERICVALGYIHGLWACIIEIALSVLLLQSHIGIAALGPGGLCVLTGLITMWMSHRFASKAQVAWVSRIQTRVSATAKVLGGMKAVKMLGVTDSMNTLIQTLRVNEIKSSTSFRKLMLVRLGLAKGSELFAPAIAFAAIAGIANATGVPFNVATAYASLSIVGLLTTPLNMAIQTLPLFIAAFGCFDRIQKFINLPAQRDHRLKNSPRTSYHHAGGLAGADIPLQDLSPKPDMPGSVIKVQDASFSWAKDTPVVSDVSFEIRRHDFTFIVGAVGSGKSTLLKGLIGETPSTKGFVYTESFKAGFVDQTSWIQNGTLQNNVLAMSAYDRDWYRDVIYACGLQEDITILPRGDQTRVGSSGISLSGGQKQRLALARAVYSREPLLILDDCFSGLDAETEDQIFNRLLGKNGIARKNKITVILVTHATHRLSFADKIIVLNNGKVAEQGSFSYLTAKGSYVSTVMRSHHKEDQQDEDKREQNHTEGLIAPIESYRTGAGDQQIEEAAAEVNRQVGDFSTYRYYLDAAGKFNAMIFLLGVTGFCVFQKLPDLWVTFWAGAVQEHGNSVNGMYLAIFITFEIIAAISLILGGYFCYIRMVAQSATHLHQTLLDTILAAPLLFFTSTDLGVSVNRFSQDMTLVDNELPNAYVEFIASSVLGFVEAILMCLSAGYFAASMPFVLFIMYVLQLYYLRTSRQLRLLDLEAKSPLYSHFMETLEGLVTVRAFGWAQDFERINSRLLDTSQKPFYLLFCVQRWLGLVLDLTVAGLTVLLMVLVVKLRATVNPGFVGLALVNVNDFNLCLTELLKAWTLMETSMGAISRVKSFEADTAKENLPHEVARLPESQWPSKGFIVIKDLWAAYRPDTPVLKNINLSISGGKKIGICGSSGSGKSSIIAALFRMLEMTSGSIEIDGVDISTLPRQEVRLNLNVIPQDPYFFKGSVRLNLDPLGRCADPELIAALKRVQLWLIVEGKGGLDAAGEPEMFSHGQRQLFCLARALLHPSKIVVLDEATSSMDTATDKVMQDIIREEFSDCTILAVAHRLDTILDFDQIAVLKAGRLIEYDEPGKLLSRDSVFKALYESS